MFTAVVLLSACGEVDSVGFVLTRSGVRRHRGAEDVCAVRSCGTDAGQSVNYFTLQLKPKPFSEKTELLTELLTFPPPAHTLTHTDTLTTHTHLKCWRGSEVEDHPLASQSFK